MSLFVASSFITHLFISDPFEKYINGFQIGRIYQEVGDIREIPLFETEDGGDAVHLTPGFECGEQVE
jgi:hypothetical protein